MKFTRHGYIEVLRDDVVISRHTAAEEAYESAYRHAEANGGGIYTIRYPNRELDLSTINQTVNQDATAPSAPVLSAVLNGVDIDLSWPASTDNVGVAGYEVYHSTDGTTWSLLTTTSGLTYTHAAPGDGVHRHRALAFDAKRNLSGWSATTTTNIDTEAPSASALTAVSASSTQINLSCLAATDNVGVVSYKFEWSANGSTGWTELQNSLARTYSHTGLVASTTYYYRVSALDATGNQSAYDTASATTDAASDSFPIYSYYDAFISGWGGTPVPESNTRYWNKPDYPTGGTPVSIGATISAPGTYYLEDGSYTGGFTISADNVTLYAQTKGGATITGKIVVNGTNCSVMGFGWTGTSSNAPYCVDANGAYGLYAYLSILSSFAPADDSVNNHLIEADGAYTRVCYCTVTNWRGGGRFVNIVGTSAIPYCRVDHNKVLEMFNVDATNPDNEIIQVGQDQYGTKYHALIDNNYFYRWNNNGGVRAVNAELETFSIKADCALVVQNVFQSCTGTVNLRKGGYCGIIANYWFNADGLNEAGGVGVNGAGHVVACNYFAGLNPNASYGYSASLRISDGDNSQYYATVNGEFSFNTMIDCGEPIIFGPLGLASPPNNNKFYNNAINKAGAQNAIQVESTADTNSLWYSNMIEPTVGRSPSGITAETPELTLTNGIYYPTASGNCDSGATTGYSALITHDILGNAIDSKIGAVHGTPAANVYQSIIDAAGST